MKWLRPRASLEQADVRRAMRMLLYDGMCSQLMLVLTTGPFIVAYALHLGANNIVIGLLASIMPLSQIAQIPSIYLVERVRHRKMLVVVSAVISRLAWLPIVLIPWVVPPGFRVAAMLFGLSIHYALGSVAGCAFNSWVRDVVPEKEINGFFGRRMAVATLFGAMASVGGAIFVDYYLGRYAEPVGGYTVLFLAGAAAGLLGAVALARTPEPAMAPSPDLHMGDLLRQPFSDRRFRSLLIFLGWWNFAINFAAPFFAVYLINRIHLSMTWVLGLAVLSQLINVVFYQIWSRFADRFSNKSVLLVCGPLFIGGFLLWPFTTLPDPHALTMPLLIFIHIMSGMSLAGVTLCANNLAMKSAPHGKATSYLAVNALISGLTATIAPILAGLAADWFNEYELKLTLSWTFLPTGETHFTMPTLDLRGLDFTFIAAFVMGLYALHRLLCVREEGEVEDAVVLRELISDTARMARQVSSVAGLRHLTYFPYSALRQIMRRREDV